MREVKIMVGNISLSEYCKKNSIEYNKVYWHIKQGRSIEYAISMATNGVPPSKHEIEPCKYCGSTQITVVNQGDKYYSLYYARCAKCSKWSPYEFCGTSPKKAVEAWCFGNRAISTRDGNLLDDKD